MTAKNILFVCMGNICRSPTAEGVFRKLLGEAGNGLRVEIDSAGTHGYHIGSAPDRRSQAVALRRQIDISTLRARQVTVEDFARFDLVLAMDEDNLAILRAQCPPEYRSRLRLFLEFGSMGERNVPDPYYGGDTGFEHVLDLVEDAARGLIATLQRSET
ncbi:MAG TPA: low molecular weight protein-tyrosine-phosphatase [Gammaproteobacteria bacterium]